MSVDGYGGSVMRGTVVDGFSFAELPSGFAAELETKRALPACYTF